MMITQSTEGVIGKAFRVFLMERRLPYSWSRKLQDSLYKGPLDAALKAIVNTPPIACDTEASTELHMVTCVRDLNMAVAACRSLLRFEPEIAVVFHGDDSLQGEHAEFLRAAVPGARVHLYHEANSAAQGVPEIYELRKQIPGRFSLGEGYERHRKAWALKVFDFHLLARVEKVVVLDSDTLFLQRPDELIEWLKGEGIPGFYSVPLLPNLRVADEDWLSAFPTARPIRRFNGGFYGFNRQELSIDLMRETMQRLLDNPAIPVLGDECIWRFAFGHVDAGELPYDFYPLTTHPDRSRKLKENLGSIKYVHFILKHRGGFYRQLAEQVKKELTQGHG